MSRDITDPLPPDEEEKKRRARQELARRELARRELARRGVSFDSVESGGSTTSEPPTPEHAGLPVLRSMGTVATKIGQAAQHPEQFGAGVGEVLPIAAKNLGGIIPDALKPDLVERGEEAFGSLLEQRSQETDPDEPGEGLARILGRGLGEGAAGVALGSTKPFQALGAVASQTLGRGESVARVVPQILGDIGVGSTIALDREQAIVPTENPFLRFGGEVALAVGGNVLGEAARPLLKGVFKDAHARNERELAERALKSFVESQSEDSPAVAAWKAAADVEETTPLAPRDVASEGVEVDPLVNHLRGQTPGTEIAGFQKLDNGEWVSPQREVLTEQQFLENNRQAIQNRKDFDDYKKTVTRDTEKLRAERDANIDKIDMSDDAIRKADETASQRLKRATGDVFYRFRSKESLKEWFRSVNTRIFDDSAIFNRAFKDSNIRPSRNPYYIVRNMKGAAAHGTWMRKLGVFRSGTMDLRSPSFDQALAHSGDVDKLEKFVTALRASNYAAVVGEDGVSRRAGLTKEEINAWMTFGKDQKVKEAADMLFDYNRQMLLLLEEEGVLPSGSAAKILAHPDNHFYMPMQRELDLIQGKVGGVVGLGSPIKVRTEGRTATILSPLESMVQQTYTYAELMARARLLRGIMEAADEGPNDFIREIDEIPDFAKAIEGASQSLRTLLPGGIVDEMDSTLRMGITPKTTIDGEAILPIRDANGKQRHFKVHKDLYEALTIMPPHHYNAVSKLLISGGRALRTGVTIMPDFWLSNMYRDTIMASVVKGSLKDALRDMTAGMGIQLNDMLHRGAEAAGIPPSMIPFKDPQELLARMGSSGGAMFEVSGMDRAESRKAIEFLGQRNLEFSQGLRKAMHAISEVLQTPGRMSENSMRIGTFKSTYEKGLADGLSEADAAARAAYEAREVTVDFARRGSALASGNMDTIFASPGEFVRLSNAFWNAGLQGTARTVRLFADPATRNRAFGTSLALITGPTLVNYGVNRDRDSYWRMPDWQRRMYTNVHIPGIDWFPDELVADPAKGFWGNVHKMFWREWNADKGSFDIYLRFPSAHELGLVFQTMPLIMMESIDPRNPSRKGTGALLSENLTGILNQEIKKFIPNPLGTPGSVAFGVARNKDFTGANIVNPNVLAQNIDPSLKGQGSAVGTMASETISGMTGGKGPTPEQVDHVVEGFSGGLGKALVDALNVAFWNETLSGPRAARKLAEHRAWQRFFTLGDERGNQHVRDVYDDLDKLERAENDANKLEETPGRQLQAIQTRLPEGQYQRLNALRDLVKVLSDHRQDFYQHENADKDPEGNYYDPQSKRQVLDAISLQVALLARIGSADQADRDRIRKQYGDELGGLEESFLDAFDEADAQMGLEEAQTGADKRLFQGRDTKVVRTIDGDTAVLPDSTHVRFYNVLAQEVGTEVGDSLAVRVRELLVDQRVRVSIPGPSRDGYNRLLADLILPTGENVSDIVKKEQERLVREKRAREILQSKSLR